MELQEQKPNIVKAVFSLMWEIIRIIWKNNRLKSSYNDWRSGYEKRRDARVERATLLHSVDQLCKKTNGKTSER